MDRAFFRFYRRCKKIRILNYFLIILLSIIKIGDVILTTIGLNHGAIELNPLGFSMVPILLNILLIIFLCCINYLLKDKLINSFITSLVIIVNLIGLYVIINNINVIIKII